MSEFLKILNLSVTYLSEYLNSKLLNPNQRNNSRVIYSVPMWR